MNTTATLSRPRKLASKAETGPYRFPKLIPRTPLEDFNANNLPLPDQKQFEDIKQIMVDEYDNFTGTANWVWWENGAWSAKRFRACHAALTDLPKGKLYATENAARRVMGKDYKNLSRPFLSWFLYHSPYGEMIINRNDFEFCQDYGFITHGDIPQPLLMNLSIISRHFKECGEPAFKAFNEAVGNQGIDPFIAYQLIFNSNLSALQTQELFDASIWNSRTNHRASGALGPKSIVNYFRGKWGKQTRKRPMHEVISIRGASSLFCNRHDLLFNEWQRTPTFLEALDQAKKGNNQLEIVEIYQPPNPFKEKSYGGIPELKKKYDFAGGDNLFTVMRILQTVVEQELNK